LTTLVALAGPFVATDLVCGAEEPASASSERADLFKRLDADGDGQIAPDEVSEGRRRLFGRLLRRGDANADGKLSLEEFTGALSEERSEPPVRPVGQPSTARPAGQASPQRPGGLLRVLDTDGDGKLSKEEIAAASESLRKLDKDNDGEVSQRELRAVFSPQPGQVPAPAAKRPDGTAPREPAPAEPARPEPARLLERLRSMDADGDGKWGESELPPFLRQQFAAIDANKDGLADADEIRQALPSLRRPGQ
jgi:Ca2+-binding EF-hand superfamily protein